MPFTYPYPRPSVTCDVVAFTLRENDLAVLLIQRKDAPFRGRWALPGGFVNENEPLTRAAARELEEETGVSGVRLEQLGAFGDPGRDPRGHTVTVAFTTFMVAEGAITAGDDAARAEWKTFRSLSLSEVQKARSMPPPPVLGKPKRRSALPRGGVAIELAFDHAKIVSRAYNRLCRHLDDPVHDASFDIVPSRFTLPELKRLYEVVLGRRLSSQWFRRYFLARGLVVPATSKKPKASAQLYRWNRRSSK